VKLLKTDIARRLWESLAENGWIPARFVVRTGRFYHSRPGVVELDGPADQRQRMFDQVARGWQRLGEQEPYWSVLTTERFKRARIAATHDEFYRSGKGCLFLIGAFFARGGQDLEAVRSVLELGCGVGRESVPLASRFEQVVAIDVSAAHLELARQAVARHHCTNVQFIRLESIEALAGLPDCDLFYSVLALQHNPPPVILETLSHALARVRPGGHALFQVPTFRQDYRFAWREQLAKGDAVGMELHVVPQAAVHALLRRHGFDLLEVHEDRAVGDPDTISNTFFARKGGG
jgi:SAM-dependent methyltransferase